MFWTQEIPRGSFSHNNSGNRARLRLNNLPIPDTFFYSNNVSVSAEIDVDVTWRATSGFVERGRNGPTVGDNPDPLWGAFEGNIATAHASGTGGGAETGFNFRTGDMSSDGFYASLGYERNGVYLS